MNLVLSRKGSVRWRALAALMLACAMLVGPGIATAAKPKPAATATLSGVVNVNTASPEQLTLLPGVGESRAQAIVAARKQRGGFRSVDQLVEVKGIGESLLDKMRPHVTLQGKTTAQKP